MNLFKKSVATGMLFLFGMGAMVNPASAGWFGRKDDAETCKAKFDDKCAIAEESKTACADEYKDFYVITEKLKTDLQSLKDSQAVSEKIFGEMQVAYDSWKHDGFRIDTKSYTDYAILKSKFVDENREISEQQALVVSDMKDMIKFLAAKKSKQNYVSALDSALEAYYNYSAAAAREALPTVK